MANIKRLKRLVLVLERVAKDKKKRREFDMTSWAIITPECGTHLCACGWAAIDPVLNKQGLRLGRLEHQTRSGQVLTVRRLRFGRFVGFEAAAKFFGIDGCESLTLFSPNEYPTKESIRPVINRIKAFIRDTT